MRHSDRTVLGSSGDLVLTLQGFKRPKRTLRETDAVMIGLLEDNLLVLGWRALVAEGNVHAYAGGVNGFSVMKNARVPFSFSANTCQPFGTRNAPLISRTSRQLNPSGGAGSSIAISGERAAMAINVQRLGHRISFLLSV